MMGWEIVLDSSDCPHAGIMACIIICTESDSVDGLCNYETCPCWNEEQGEREVE